MRTLFGVLTSSLLVFSAEAAFGASIDTSDRDEVVAAYEEEFDGPVVPIEWSGNIANCVAGTTSEDFRASVVDRINYYRSMAGSPGDVVENPTFNRQAQATALIMSAQGFTTHNPKRLPGNCFTELGWQGARHSNLAMEANGVEAINQYFRDFGPDNHNVGHRFLLLRGNLTDVGTGDTDDTNALVVQTDWTFEQPDHTGPAGGAAWPNAGYVPSDIIPDRWSIQIPGADLRTASVRVFIDNGNRELPAQVIHRGENDDARGSLLVWTFDAPRELDRHRSLDETYRVAIEGIGIDGRPTVVVYDVIALGDKPAPNRTSDETCLTADGGDPTTRLYADSDRHAVYRLYVAYFLRCPDAGGIDFWHGEMINGRSLAHISAFFAQSPEFEATYGALRNDQFVRLVYNNVLGRSPDRDGYDYWLGELNAGLNRGALMARFADSNEFVSLTGTRAN